MRGELDMATVRILESGLDGVYAADDVTDLVIDLSEVSFMGSWGLATLVTAVGKCAGRSIFLAVYASEPVQRAVKASGLDGHLPLRGPPVRRRAARSG